MKELKKRFLERTFVFCPLGLLLAAFSVVFLDHGIASYCTRIKPDGDIEKILVFSEFFGHGYGIAVACIMIFFLDEKNRLVIPRIVAGVSATGIFVWVLKLSVSRIRPKHFDFTQNIFHSFVGWGSPWGASELHSFPSGHTAAATALAIILTWKYPQGRYLFATLAVCVALQRISSGAHYPSDTIVGAFIGFAVSGLFISVGALPKLFGSFEKRNNRY